MNIVEMLYQREDMFLSEYACKSRDTKGREVPLEPDNLRTDFQRDRDRIIHSKSFRRLMHKTQVFLNPVDEHYRTRLTHTLEVTQIARTIARSLCLNEDLVEAASLGHDLGHTPFGHAGEAVLQECFSSDFTHSAQSLRVVEKLERNGEGLNLTLEVRDGIVNHSGSDEAFTLEGRIVKYADRIAYINHDIDDAIRGQVLTNEDIPEKLRKILGNSQSQRIDTMVMSLIQSSRGKSELSMDSVVYDAMMQLRDFMYERVYKSPIAKREEKRAKDMLKMLFEYYTLNYDKLPEEYRRDDDESIERHVTDYIAGMTDRYATSCFEEIFVPKVWMVNKQ